MRPGTRTTRVGQRTARHHGVSHGAVCPDLFRLSAASNPVRDVGSSPGRIPPGTSRASEVPDRTDATIGS